MRHLLNLVGGVTCFHPGTERPALYGVGEDHNGLAVRFLSAAEGCSNLGMVVATAREPFDVFIAQVLY